MATPLQIMVADDEEVVRHLLKETLEAEGFRVIPAADGNVALSLIAEKKPDLLILDIMMPGLNGFAVLEMIRQHSNIPDGSPGRTGHSTKRRVVM